MLTGLEIDSLFRWPKGRAEKWARSGRLPHYLLPDGSIRFSEEELKGLIRHVDHRAAGAGAPGVQAIKVADRQPA